MKKGLLFAVILVFVLFVFSGCGNGARTGNASVIDSLKTEIATKELLLEEVFISLNDITSNLNAIRVREGVISEAVNVGEYMPEPISAIKEGVAAIDELLISNREALKRLEINAAELRKTSGKAASLDALIAEMRMQAEEKDREISSLKKSLLEMAREIEELTGRVGELTADVSELTEEKDRLQTEVTGYQDNINAAYYIIGSKKDLLNNNVIYKSGAVGRTLKVNENKELGTFIRIDTRYFTEIMIGYKGVEIITTHPDDSYELVKGEKGMVNSLVITEPGKFWEYSKILVISYK